MQSLNSTDSAIVGMIQCNSTDDLEYNFKKLEQQTTALAQQGAKIVFTPENVLLFSNTQAYQQLAELLGQGPVQKRLASLAKRMGIWLHIGSFPIAHCSGKLTTTSLLFDDDGKLAAHYSKIHLFDVDVSDGHGQYRESDTYHAGSQPKVVDTPVGPLGLSICYDLRFAGLYQSLRQAGAKVMVVPAAFTQVTGAAHWEPLLRARAIENQCWVIATGQCGQHSQSRKTWGHSMVIDPWGRMVESLTDTAGHFVVSIDHQQTDEVRTAMPVAEHARFHSQFKE